MNNSVTVSHFWPCILNFDHEYVTFRVLVSINRDVATGGCMGGVISPQAIQQVKFRYIHEKYRCKIWQTWARNHMDDEIL